MDTKICKECGFEKPLTEYHKNGSWYRGRCKKCHNKRFQPSTGKPNTGRFKKGHVPISPFKKGIIPWNKGRKMPLESVEKMITTRRSLGKKRRCWNEQEWSRKVKERDSFTCQRCGSKEDLNSHHIIPWKESEEKRFCLDNGLTLCKSCHTTVENTGKTYSEKRKKNISLGHKGQKCHWKGKTFSEDHKKKLSESRKGKEPWNKGNINNPDRKICKDCNVEKEITEFTPQGNWYKNRCKKCRNKLLREKRA